MPTYKFLNNDTGEDTKVSDEEITKAKAILEKAAKQDQATSNKNTISSYIS